MSGKRRRLKTKYRASISTEMSENNQWPRPDLEIKTLTTKWLEMQEKEEKNQKDRRDFDAYE